MQNVIKNLFSGLTSQFSATNLGAVNDEYEYAFIHNEEVIPGQVEPQYVGSLLLDIGKGFPRVEMQA